MKNLYSLFLCFVIALAAASCTSDLVVEDKISPTDESQIEKVSENEVLPYIKGQTIAYLSEDLAKEVETELAAGGPGTRSSGMSLLDKSLGIKSIGRLFPHAGEYEERTRREGLHRWYLIEYAEDVPLTRASSAFLNIKGIEYVENVRKVCTNEFNDLTSQMWGLWNRSNPDYDINIRNAWKYYTTGSPEVIVGVIDGGIEMDHADLTWNCATKDNFNFVDNSPEIYSHSHGTHVAGTIAAVSNNGKGVCGIAGGDYLLGRRGATLMSCQVFKTFGGKSYTGNIPSAIKWAADHGAVICQNSWGYSYDSDGDGKLSDSEMARALAGRITSSDRAAVDYFIKYAGCDNDGNQLPSSPMKGGICVFSAGNDNLSNGVPANYAPIIAVASIDSKGAKSSFSNYGPWVDIAAPGSNIYSTVPGGEIGSKSGTSMSCPHVSGALALIIAEYGGQGFDNKRCEEILLGGADYTRLPASLQIGGLLDVYGSMSYASDSEPAPVGSIDFEPGKHGVQLTWKATSDNLGKPAHAYRILYGKDRDKVSVAGQAEDGVGALDVFPRKASGATVTQMVDGLDFDSVYYIKVNAYSNPMLQSEGKVMEVSTLRNNPPVITIEYEGECKVKSHEVVRIPVKVVDPDGHKFSVSISSGSGTEDLAQASSGEYHIFISGMKTTPGNYSLIIKAEDEYGKSSESRFEYSVLPNHPPKVVKHHEDLILTAPAERYTIDLKQCFFDEDGETLMYNVSYSADKILYASITGGIATFTALGSGVTDVTVSASDMSEESCQMSFKVGVANPDRPIEIWPIPVQDVMNISTGVRKDADVRVFSSLGMVVKEAKGITSILEPMQVNMAGIAPGRYKVEVNSGEEKYVKDIIKK